MKGRDTLNVTKAQKCDINWVKFRQSKVKHLKDGYKVSSSTTWFFLTAVLLWTFLLLFGTFRHAFRWTWWWTGRRTWWCCWLLFRSSMQRLSSTSSIKERLFFGFGHAAPFFHSISNNDSPFAPPEFSPDTLHVLQKKIMSFVSFIINDGFYHSREYCNICP